MVDDAARSGVFNIEATKTLPNLARGLRVLNQKTQHILNIMANIIAFGRPPSEFTTNVTSVIKNIEQTRKALIAEIEKAGFHIRFLCGFFETGIHLKWPKLHYQRGVK